MFLQIFLMALCILFSAYFSATETAFSSLNKTKLKTLAEKGNKRANVTLGLAENYDKLISTILIGNNIVNIAVASIGTLLFVDLLKDPDVAATVSTVVVTVAVLIFGEITPKGIAKDMPEKFALFSTPFIRLLIVVLTPLNFIFSLWKKLVSLIFKPDDDDKMSQEELLMIVEEAEQEGGIDTDEGDLLRNAIEFTEIRAEDILTHRIDLEAVAQDTPKEEIAQKFSDTRYSRLLVYNENIDDIVGVIHLKDFYKDNGILKDDISTIMSPPLFIHKFEKIDDLLKQLQQAKSHIAVVVDEYGGTLGIVTMEDILEELVGDIWDEHDEVIEPYTKVSENTYLVDCTSNFEEFSEYFEIEYETESISVGGFVLEQMGKIPTPREKFTFEHLDFVIEESDTRRVISVKVVKNPKPEPEE